jgi:K+-transporting ATPase ATPase C chain
MKTLLIGLRAWATLTALTGILYPLLVTGLGNLISAPRVGGSLVVRDGTVLGSQLIAQRFVSPRYFWPRPSAVNYEATASGASNQGPTSADLSRAVLERTAAGAVAEERYSSASGLDPDLSPEAALAQIGRVAKARGMDISQVHELVLANVTPRQFGVLGEPRVNVLRLNLELDAKR